MGDPEEFKSKVHISWGMLIWAVAIAGSMGFLYSQMIHNDRQSEKNAKDNRLYTEQEVGGLRADWERDREQMIKRIDELEKYHKE